MEKERISEKLGYCGYQSRIAGPHPPGKDLGRPPRMPQGPQIYPLTSPHF
uniref:Uncharacterized protein n=1 Tax=Rhizophagus irregularis (strain DAOM 181602 / DAOM 197198 / MUCL 43194) TaxID=747089 RepID=U9TB40_RHIID